MSWYLFGKHVAIGPLLRTFFPTKVVGRRNIPRKGGVILASNHLSVADSFFLPVHVHRRVTFFAKNEYFTGTGLKGWLKRWFFTAIGQIPVDRSSASAAQAVIDTGVRVLSEGKVLGIYPEGTRSRDGQLHKGKVGVAQIALRAGVPIVPVAMIGTDKVNPVGARLWRPHRVEIRIGKPIDVSRYQGMEGDRGIQRAVTDEVMYAIMSLSGQEYVDKYEQRGAAA